MTHEASSDDGFTVVLIDSSEPSEGDFVYVESFENLEGLMQVEDGYPGWVDRMVSAAHNIVEARDERTQ